MAIPQKKVAPAAATKPVAKPATKVAPKAEKAEKAERVKKPGVGDFVKAQILAGKDNDKILEAVSIKFPEANTTNASVNWYRSALRKAGEEVPSSRKPKAEKAAPTKAAAPVKGAVAKKAAPAKSKKASDEEGGFD